jgi:hypothetical protein
MEHFIRSNVFLSAAEKAALNKIARKRKVSASSVLREVLDKGLNLAPSTTDHSHIRVVPGKISR